MMTSCRLALATTLALLSAPESQGVERSNWALDPSRTHIGFTIDAIGFPSTKGEFRAFEGRLSVDFVHPERSRVAFTVKAESLDVGSPSFDATLRGAAFLNVARFPDIQFSTTSVRKLDEQHVVVEGELEMLGVTLPLPVEVNVERVAGASRLGFTAHARIDRLAWGMNSGYPIISKDVFLEVSSEAVAK
jgi:polyisoprenoid-binding protein YceI